MTKVGLVTPDVFRGQVLACDKSTPKKEYKTEPYRQDSDQNMISILIRLGSEGGSAFKLNKNKWRFRNLRRFSTHELQRHPLKYIKPRRKDPKVLNKTEQPNLNTPLLRNKAINAYMDILSAIEKNHRLPCTVDQNFNMAFKNNRILYFRKSSHPLSVKFDKVSYIKIKFQTHHIKALLYYVKFLSYTFSSCYRRHPKGINSETGSVRSLVEG